MADARMQITIDGNTTGAINATKQTQSAITGLSNTLKGLAIGGGALFLAKKGFDLLSEAVKGTVKFLGQCIEEAGNSEVQLTKLNTALKSTGNFTEEGSKALVDYAASLQAMTAFEDDAIVSVEAMLATFKLAPEEIKVATQATLDLAAATGQDLQSAAILMGKAFVGETGMLKRYGIMVDENKLKTEGWKAVIDEINVEFGGQAVAQGETYAGMLERMKNNLSDVRETIGKALLPALKDLMDRFMTGTPIVDDFGNVIGKTEAPMEKLKEFAEQAGEKLAGLLEKLMEADWDKIIDNIKTTAKVLGVLGGITALGAVVVGINKVVTAIKGLETVLVTFAGGIGAAVVGFIINLTAGIYGIIETLEQADEGLITNTEKWTQLAYPMTVVLQNLLGIDQETKNTDSSTQQLTEKVITADGAFATYAASIGIGVEKTNNFANANDESTESVNGNIDSILRLTNAIAGLPDVKKVLIEIEQRTRGYTPGTYTSNTEYGIAYELYGKKAMGGIIGASIPHAASGMIVPQSGREVPIIAHEGEIILNDSQQGNIAEAIWGIANGKIGAGKNSQPIYITIPVELDGQVISQKTSEYLYKSGQTTRIGAGIR
jgi:hypothetical protein